MELEDTVGADLGDGCDSPSLQVFAQLCDKGRRRSGCGSRIFGKVAAEAGIDEELFAMIGLVKLDEEDALFGSADNLRGCCVKLFQAYRAQVIDIRDSQ